MNPQQMAQQIKAKLEAITWPDGAQDEVFGTQGVVVFAGRPSEEQIPPGFPWVLVGIGSGSADEEDPALLTQTFDLICGVEVAGDPMGEHAVIGSSVANLGKSAGRGVLEVQERMRAAVADLTGADGAKIILSETSIESIAPLAAGRHIVLGTDTLTAVCTRALHYAAPQQLTRSGSTWTWQGSHCSSRFDFLRYRMAYLAGVTPPSSPSAGTVVYTGTAATTIHAPTVGRAYAVFTDYCARGTGSVEGTSSIEVGCWRKV